MTGPTAAALAPRRGVQWVDLLVVLALVAGIYGMVVIAREWTGVLHPVAEIQLRPRFLPLYTLYSLTRGLLAYAISFLFTMIYGYAAARVSGADRVLLPVLDILQSIPVLGFLPGFVLALVHLFPHRNLGLEMASVLMIFTGQVWNMTFAFYGSLKAVPEEFQAVARLTKLTWWQRFFRLELAFSATSLVWNSMMSMAGGWFFLTVSEAFVLGEHDFRLPGLGSYMSLAIERGDARAQWLGVLAMAFLIVFLDQLLWRPMVAWSQRFSSDQSDSSGLEVGWWNHVRRSHLWLGTVRAGKSLVSRSGRRAAQRQSAPPSAARQCAFTWARRGFLLLAGLCVAFAAIKYFHLLRGLTAHEWRQVLISTVLTFLRVIAAVVLASVWTIPVGVLIGRNPRWSRALQPVIQMVASFPAPMIFPLVVATVLALGGGLGIGSVLLLLLGTQWYILFNVIAGSSAIPPEFWEVARIHRFSDWLRWRRLVLPALFPSLLTGWITAMGGAWNASIVAEYMKYRGKTLTTVGLGALISQATDQGNFDLLAAAVGVMALVVVGFNRLVWHPLSRQAQTRFSLGN